ncbi:lipopolysaccharide biosynthesis protein [Streptomyces himalayensis]|uniref:Lipopolysaccharide biosynthesis protein n=1 Tax=Streptomyces himalayensis subsp. himalayensis TaxID=2756131 RepID=A0A7W0DIY4_9ACTN|nr:lipopolysaccharide biosynthesis protein [Streptomyces himalayensis]MBA2945204.1 lipopolysaccharide biosynthesis protein [Streptomyces himalayensis subsp. himalayensis]
MTDGKPYVSDVALADSVSARRASPARLTSTAADGVRWTLLGAVASFVVQVPYTAVMSRLLTPADFGLVGLAMFMLRFVIYFAQSGLSLAVVQRPVLEVRHVRAALAVGIATGVGMFAVCWFVTPFGVRVVNGPGELVGVCRILALTFVISAIGSTAVGLLRRDMRYKSLALTEFGSYLFGYCGIGLTSALAGSGVWSLVYAGVGQSVVMTAASIALVRHDPRPLFSLCAMREMASISTQVSCVGFLEFLTTSGETFVIGRYAGMEILGYYNRAWFMAVLPLHQVATAVNKVLFSAFSRIQAEHARLKSAYVDSLAMTTLLFLFMAATIAACSRNAVQVLLGEGWEKTADLVPPLAFLGTLNVVTYFPAATAAAMGRVWQKAVIEILHLAALVAGVGFAIASESGIHGLVIALLMCRLVQHVAYVLWMGRVIPGSVRHVVVSYMEASLVALMVGLCVLAVGHAADGIVPATAALAAQLLTAALLAGVLLRYGKLLKGIRVVHQRALVPTVFTTIPRSVTTHRKEG